ncbi:flagellar hook-associated protein FlgK [Shewanella yunxiaonensis]|uniref:Flagellar hook-associated protein 1 n=1 Tax=Shewanella yunxiaonensis TaxID=2829809 RepID=A0ABX7YVM0_9GAMM|nr:flagellar hook-associated protein FlgK [Shewanella yunxiaonensis]QUN06843.1 flagellar hook-associated protein FlgK [Shewanella yunxiaonensis]
MSVDLLNIARSGVLAAQSQIGVTSNNISNVNTDGYSRQVATQATQDSQYLGGNYYGTGTYVADVKRIYNDFAARELRIGQTTLSTAEMSYNKLSGLDQMLSNTGSTLTSSLDGFFSSLNDLADQPSDTGIRQTVLSSAQQLAANFNQMDGYLDSEMNQTNDEISGITDRINEISKEMANINQELMKTDTPDPQLLDKQDSLIKELSQYAEVNVIPLDNGGCSIMMGSSFMLVSGEVAMSMGTTTGDPYPTESALTYTLGNTTLKVDPSKLGGQLGALYDYRDNTLQPASQQLGQMALGVADAFNTLQSQGFDLSGQVGQNIFTDINDPLMAQGRVGAYTGNGGTAVLSATIDDVGALTGDSYQLRYTTSGTYELTNNQTGAVANLTLNGSALQSADGFTLNIDTGALAAGDRFEIRPTANAAGTLQVEMTDPKGLAAASPKITADTANASSAVASLVSIDNRADTNFPGTGSELTYTIDALGNYTATDANDAVVTIGTTTGTPPQISDNGFTFQVDALPASGTNSYTFDLSLAVGDNSNAIAMADLADSKIMEGGNATLADVFQQTKLDVGSQTKAAEVSMNSAQSIYDQAYNRMQSESGVNLDEEAANLMKFQQAYMASARVMTTANSIFDTLFNAVQ